MSSNTISSSVTHSSTSTSAAQTAARPLRVLAVSVPLPTADNPTTTAPQARQIESLRTVGAEVDVLEIKGLPKLKYVQSLLKLPARARNADIIHAHYGFCGWLARCQFSKPVVVSFMGTDLYGAPDENGNVDRLSRLVVQLDRWFAHTVSAVIVKSQEMADIVKPVHAHVVPNGVNMAQFQPMDQQEARAILGWTEPGQYVLFPGNPRKARKNFPLATAAIAHAEAQLGQKLHVKALDNVLPDQVPLYMNGCDAMMMTSLKEGSPNVVKEAMACNLPVISVPVGDVVELLTDVPGYSIHPYEAAPLGDALAATLRDQPAAAGRVALEQKGLDLESVARRLMDIYAEVLK